MLSADLHRIIRCGMRAVRFLVWLRLLTTPGHCLKCKNPGQTQRLLIDHRNELPYYMCQGIVFPYRFLTPLSYIFLVNLSSMNVRPMIDNECENAPWIKRFLFSSSMSISSRYGFIQID